MLSGRQVEVVVFDVDERLSDMTAMAARFAEGLLRRAGLQTAVDRTGARYPWYFTTPDRTAVGIDDLAAQLT